MILDLSIWNRRNPALLLAAIWLAVSIVCWFVGTLFVAEPTAELKAVAFAIGGFVVAAVDLSIRARYLNVPSPHKFFFRDCGGHFEGLPFWVFGIAGAITGLAFSVGLLQ